MPPTVQKKRFIDRLATQAGISHEHLMDASRRAAEAGESVERILVEEGLVGSGKVTQIAAEHLGLPAVSLANFTPDSDLLRCLPRRITTEMKVLPLAKWGSVFAFAVPDPFDMDVIDELRAAIDEKVVIYAAPRDEILSHLAQLSSEGPRGLEAALRDMPQGATEIEITEESSDDITEAEMLDLSEQEPVVRIVNSMLVDAVERGVSDVHIEPMAHTLHIRYRIDGVLYDQASPPKYMQWAIVSRIKIMAHMDIAQRRLPQDGRFSIHAGGCRADVRVSTIPSVHGEKVVMRILDEQALKPNLASLQLEAVDLSKLERAIRQPNGMILVTGPTGSGKTTTLYSILQEINDPEINIITVEDPVEYQLARVIQINVNAEVGLTFTSGLRAILRQDPDVVLLGEIRDRETAAIAVQASLTGHLVLSTLHTNDAAGAVARLVHMGIEPYLITSSLLLAQAQRVYRRLCPFCKERTSINIAELDLSENEKDLLLEGQLFRPVGCPRCSNISYSGRRAIMEILAITDEMRDMINQGANANALRAKGITDGMRTLRSAGLSRVCQGDTSLEEILRITNHALS